MSHILFNDSSKFFSTTASTFYIISFLDQAAPALLVFSATTSGTLLVSEEFPQQIKQKHCFFLKAHGEQHVNKDQPISTQVVFGDLGHSPIEQLSSFVDDVRKCQLMQSPNFNNMQ